MSGIKTLRLRIKSIKSTQKITKAMQMVAVSKLRKAKEAMEKNIPYYNTLKSAFHQVPKNTENMSHLQKLALSENVRFQKTLVIVVTSECGLCGGFNQSVLRAARGDIGRIKTDGANVKIIIVGKKGIPMMSAKFNNDVILKHSNPPRIEFSLAQDISNQVLEMMEKEDFDSCRIYFSHFKNAVVQVPVSKFIIPLIKHEEEDLKAETYEYEGEELSDTLIKMYMTAEIYKALLESRASEEAARMVAMDNATKNASEMIDKLTLVMNRTRQAAITKELIEIISGAEAV